MNNQSSWTARNAIGATLDELGRLAPGTRLAMDHMVPAPLRDEAGQSYVDLVSATTAERGEPWLSFPDPDEMRAMLAGRGYETLRSLGQRDALDAHLWRRTDALRPARLSVIVDAVRVARGAA